MGCSSLLFCICNKTFWPKIALVGKGSFGLCFQVAVHRWGSSGQGLEAGTEAEIMEEMYYWFASSCLCLASFSIQPRTACSWVALPTMLTNNQGNSLKTGLYVTTVWIILQLRLSLLRLLHCAKFLRCVKFTRTVNQQMDVELKEKRKAMWEMRFTTMEAAGGVESLVAISHRCSCAKTWGNQGQNFLPGAEHHGHTKNQVPRPKDRAVLGMLEYSKEVSVAEVMSAKWNYSFAIH